MTFEDAIRRAPVFERLELSSEDKQRSRQYDEQRERNKLKENAYVGRFCIDLLICIWMFSNKACRRCPG